MADQWPSWRYGPNGQAGVFEAESDVPAGWEDHPSKVGGEAGGGVTTAHQPTNATTTAENAAKSTEAKSQTQTDPKISAMSGVGGAGNSPASGQNPSIPAKDPNLGRDGPEVDAHGHPYDPALHAATQSKTKDGLWRLKVGAKRPDPVAGYDL